MLAFENGVLVHRGVDFTVGADIHTISENQVSVTCYSSSSRRGYENMRVGTAEGRTVGVELELTFRDSRTAERATKEVSRAIIGSGIGENQFSIERDGSLDYGFEVVMPYGEVTEYLAYLEIMLKNPIFKHVDFTTGKAGLHVNVARDSNMNSSFYFVLETLFSETALCDNSSYTSYSDHLVTTFGLRTESEFACLFSNNSIVSDIRRIESGYQPYYDKYQAVNFRGSREGTAEFRLFNPTVNFNDLKLRVLLSHAAVEYATFISSEYNTAELVRESINMRPESSWPLFYSWLKSIEIYKPIAEKLVEDEDFVNAVDALTPAPVTSPPVVTPPVDLTSAVFSTAIDMSRVEEAARVIGSHPSFAARYGSATTVPVYPRDLVVGGGEVVDGTFETGSIHVVFGGRKKPRK